MASIFTRIVQGEIPCYKIAEDDRYFAFLDINPLKKGHTLVIPKKEVDYIFDLDIEMLSGLHVFSQKIAKALDKAVPCKRVAVIVLGLEVPHAHIHLIPMDAESDVRFSNPKLKLSPEEFQQIATEIKKHL
ncbi:MAG TPA: HIT family protein [Marinilabiliales bacterium]|nr:MAG: HIT family hydrolase [Bacteroidetes bacterium GWC2_40_13]OFX73263.1 MAG: HIT family hydrolase [Bacteroidetes bacterium GWD2_40_43]OFX92118.1 MAG: HIT family hydrolase [Bacteroidetes bacterium GWE2_40_63]OFY24312.1 MAG: HIT family hydrolase [Bacteroidetes bacterium GWF2_40_13]OFZ30636.1 MAG: HIT family hydrolase [Bacteroidetes bacterium RIFOXYC2_FULL_40_12]HAM98962.1 HIT family protein [Marinilabiliales bacterium]